MSVRSKSAALLLLSGLWVTACADDRTPRDSAQEAPASEPPSRDDDGRALRGPMPREAVDHLPSENPVDDPGRWREFRTHRFDETLTDRQRETIQQLESIGYMTGSREASGPGGVVVHHQDAEPGFNLYTSGHAPEAILIDMEGEMIHRWGMDFWDLWPDYPTSADHPGTQYWRRAFLYENGDILALFGYLGIVKLDRNSRLIWANPVRSHHDLEVTEEGDIYILAAEAHLVPEVNPSEPILEDFIVVLDPDGVEKRRISVVDCVRNSRIGELWSMTQGRKGDIYHTNTLEVLDGRLANLIPEFKKGNVLIYMLYMNTVAVIDMETESIVWSRTAKTPRLYRHDPKVLPNGNMLIFENFGAKLESKVIEIDLERSAVAWEYSAGEDFYSHTCGTAERLPGGNTLVTESDNGRAFEVTPDKRIVWEFVSPHRAGDDGQLVATLFEMVRLPPDFPIGWARRPPSP